VNTGPCAARRALHARRAILCLLSGLLLVALAIAAARPPRVPSATLGVPDHDPPAPISSAAAARVDVGMGPGPAAERSGTVPRRVVARRPPPTLVTVFGQVRRLGQTLRRCEVSFLLAGQEACDHVIDWDVTDRDGSFTVQVPPGSYAVRCDVGWPAMGFVHVAAAHAALRHDIELPK
jgi:hypothetical protein